MEEHRSDWVPPSTRHEPGIHLMKRQLLSAAICAAITAHSPLSFAQSDDSGDKKGDVVAYDDLGM